MTRVVPVALALASDTSLRRAYHEDGYVVVRDLFRPDELAEVEAESRRLFDRHDLIDVRNLRCRWQACAGTGECLFECFDPVIDIGSASAALAAHPRLLKAVAAIYGEPARLFKDKLIFKPPGSKGYGLHQDYIAWDCFPLSFLTAIVPLDATNADNGATEVFPGYQMHGSLAPADGHYHELPAEAVDSARGVLLELRPGDVALFGGFTPHRSGPNRSTGFRRQLYLSYNANSEGGERRAEHYAHFIQWLRERYAEHGKTDTYFR